MSGNATPQTKLWKKSLLSGKGEALSHLRSLIIGADTRTITEQEVARSWYAIYTRPSHEMQVAKHFDVREIERYLPQYQVVHRWNNRCTKTLDVPLFPGYIFAHFAPSERRRVIEIPSVLSVVGTAGKPTPISNREIEVLRTGLRARNAEPHPFLKVGERARIIEGALAGMEGVIVRSKNNFRVVISLDLIMQSVAVEVDWSELEPVAPSGLHHC